MNRELTDDEYGQIVTYLQSIGVHSQQQQAEMADHLAVVTELHLNSGQGFDAAFSQAKSQLSEKEMLEIKQNAASFTHYPRFLGRHFLIGLATVTLLLFAAGLLMRYYHQPHHHIWIVIGRRSFAFVLLPMLLLYNLTEYANKTRQVLTFMFQFSLFQTVADYLVRQKLNLALLTTSAVIGALWLILFWLLPLLRVDKKG